MFENIIFFSFGYCYFISLLRTQGVPILLHLHICEERPILHHCTPTLAKKWQYFHFLLPLDFDLGQLSTKILLCWFRHQASILKIHPLIYMITAHAAVPGNSIAVMRWSKQMAISKIVSSVVWLSTWPWPISIHLPYIY